MAETSKIPLIVVTPVDPEPPSEDEQTYYYYGLPSQPRLIDRSSTRGWRNQHLTGGPKAGPHHQPMKRQLLPVGSHPILEHWNKGMSGTLVPGIMRFIRTLNWSTIDCVRLGYQNAPERPKLSDGHVILLISVDPQANPSWDQAFQAALHCKGVLVQHGISDVHCEVKEGRWCLSADPTVEDQNAPRLGPLEGTGALDPGWLDASLSESICADIRPLSGDRTGTKGVYLQLNEGKPAKRMLLTCRHVAVPPSSNINDNQAVQGIYHDLPIIQPTEDTISTFRQRSEDFLAKFSSNKARLDELAKQKGGLARSQKKERKEVIHYLDLVSKKVELAKSFEQPSSRVIGRTIFAPPLHPVPASFPSRSHWFCDWALIDLDQGKHLTKVSSLPNSVCLTLSKEERSKLQQKFTSEGLILPPGKDGTVNLAGIIPEDEIWKTNGTKPLTVGKFGGATHLTYGVANNAKSFVSHYFDDRRSVSEEWCIIGLHAAFSNLGDSGACVWDAVNWRMGGMITSGNTGWRSGSETPRELDLTYATPMERLVKDIRQNGFHVSVPAAKK